ncbi:MAG: hypothetical protein WCF06_10930 [Nitrososphaeraceae archaeon]
MNKDVEIDDTCQLTLPDIQLKDADRVFRVYVKSLDVLRNYERKSLYDGKS